MENLLALDSRLQHLDGNALAKFAIVALAEIDHRHAAVSDFAGDPVRAHSLVRHGGGAAVKKMQRRRVFQQTIRLVVIQEQRFHFLPQRVIVTAGLADKKRGAARLPVPAPAPRSL